MGPKRKLYGAAAAAVERKRLRQLRLAEETAATGPPTSADPVESGEDPIHRELNALAISGAALPDRPEDAIEYAKRRLENYKEKNEKDKTPLVLNAFLDFLPKDGKQNLITDIVTRPEDEDLHQLVRQLRAHIIVPLALSAASSSSASSLEGRQGTRPATSHQRRNRSGQRKFKEACLDRDNNRCVVSGLYDVKRAEKLPEEEYNEHPKANTECAHVIPFSASAESPDGNIDPEKEVARNWAFVYRYFPDLVAKMDVRSASAINQPRNAMTLIQPFHAALGSFTMGFEKVPGDQNSYIVRTFKGFQDGYNFFLPKDGRVIFESKDSVESPDQTILAFHLAICNILHATGMGEDIERYFDNLEEIGCLAEDGSTDIETAIARGLARAY
ncbi:hypothetical protein M432DRAFT_550657 [Thermoascus aurantiacus ATCC 26904]